MWNDIEYIAFHMYNVCFNSFPYDKNIGDWLKISWVDIVCKLSIRLA